MRYLKEQKEFYDEVERINQNTDNLADMQAEIANDPQVEPIVAESPAIKGKLGKRKKSIVVETAESKRSSPRIKV